MEEEMLWLRSAWIMWLDDHNRQADDDHEKWTWKDDRWSSPSGKPQPPTLLNLRKVEGADHWRQATVCGTNRPRKQWQLILHKQHMLLVVDYKFKSVFYSRFEKKKIELQFVQRTNCSHILVVPRLSERFEVDNWVVKVSSQPRDILFKKICKEMPSRVAGRY